jgi:hypothetical protein
MIKKLKKTLTWDELQKKNQKKDSTAISSDIRAKYINWYLENVLHPLIGIKSSSDDDIPYQ